MVQQISGKRQILQICVFYSLLLKVVSAHYGLNISKKHHLHCILCFLLPIIFTIFLIWLSFLKTETINVFLRFFILLLLINKTAIDFKSRTNKFSDYFTSGLSLNFPATFLLVSLNCLKLNCLKYFIKYSLRLNLF